jgi:hypothetical protein
MTLVFNIPVDHEPARRGHYAEFGEDFGLFGF